MATESRACIKGTLDVIFLMNYTLKYFLMYDGIRWAVKKLNSGCRDISQHTNIHAAVLPYRVRHWLSQHNNASRGRPQHKPRESEREGSRGHVWGKKKLYKTIAHGGIDFTFLYDCQVENKEYCFFSSPCWDRTAQRLRHKCTHTHAY